MSVNLEQMSSPTVELTKILSHTPSSGQKKRRRPRKKIDSDSQSTSSASSDDQSSNGGSKRCAGTMNHRPTGGNNNRRRKRKGARTDTSDMTDEEKSRYIAMDCEMVGVGYNGQRSALARVCIINWNGKKLMDCHVRPTEPVTDYRTFVSGITHQDLESGKALDLQECRVRVLELLEGKILVGHALKNDLHALHITHPWYETRDTAKYEPFMKVRFDDGILWPRKLKELAKEKLGRDVQRPGVSHSPFEDAKTALDLFKLVHRKWEKAMAYKISKTREIQQQLTNGVSEPCLPLAQ